MRKGKGLGCSQGLHKETQGPEDPAISQLCGRTFQGGESLGKASAFGNLRVFSCLLGLRDLPRLLPQLQSSLKAFSWASTCAQLRVLRAELKPRKALAGVAALGVDTDAVAFTDPGVQLTFVRVCKGKERVVDASRAGSQPRFLAQKHLEGPLPPPR